MPIKDVNSSHDIYSACISGDSIHLKVYGVMLAVVHFFDNKASILLWIS